jgi:hypothetical protein
MGESHVTIGRDKQPAFAVAQPYNPRIFYTFLFTSVSIKALGEWFYGVACLFESVYGIPAAEGIVQK